MQNIADAFRDTDKDHLRTFIVLSPREKTISVTKKSFSKDSHEDTPESAFYDLIKENTHLLQQYGFHVPQMNSMEDYFIQGPSALFLYHPALGPLYSIISQKIKKGSFAKNSELQLEIAEVHFENVDISGSLLIEAKHVQGSIDPKIHELRFHNHVGCCRFKNVVVSNLGIDRDKKNNSYWKNEINRKEACKITLEGDSVFIAEDVSFTGDLDITVPSGMCCRASMSKDKKLILSFEPLQDQGFYWNYEMKTDGNMHKSDHRGDRICK